MTAGTWSVQQYTGQNDDIDFSPLEEYCSHIQPIQPNEYIDRHKKLAETLRDEEAEALVMEGGATMSYYTNIDWELTERAFMVIFQLDERNVTTSTGIRMTFVTPSFEAARALENLKKANLPTSIQPDIVEWLEHKSPFDAVKQVFGSNSNQKKIGRVLVEQNARLFIYQGVTNALPYKEVDMAPQTIRMLRMVKSDAELNIMRCVNAVTELAIRSIRPYIKEGMTETDIQDIMSLALHKAGLTNVWVYALVDENAGLPHGDSSEKKVTDHSTVLIDTGGELLGYQSDTTRTFFMGKRGFNRTIEDAWYLVRRAQENVLNLVGPGMTCSQVDLIARHIINEGGYGAHFTHRLGHGIGKEMHEEPYLNQGNIGQFLAPGMTFSVE